MWKMPLRLVPGATTTSRCEAPKDGACTRGTNTSPGSGSSGIVQKATQAKRKRTGQRMPHVQPIAIAPGREFSASLPRHAGHGRRMIVKK